MSDVFYMRAVDPAATVEDVLEGGSQAGGCFDLHRVDWRHSFLADGGRRVLCWYRAPDAESARIALRELGADMSAVWPGRVVGGVEPGDAAVSRVDVLVDVALPDASTDTDEASAGTDETLFETLRQALPGSAELAFGFVANRRDRAVCLLRGADAEAIRAALAGGGFADASAWSCTVVTPPTKPQPNSNPR